MVTSSAALVRSFFGNYDKLWFFLFSSNCDRLLFIVSSLATPE
uniref:Uncharacterized protein n=1 Tax=Nelumbo nucifera TaxID=4432 RepID=A0A822XVS6_NELNU|nr:TPA_asm: hypothetical protein HUJ06_025316 [Nelumbo nucifera]